MIEPWDNNRGFTVIIHNRIDFFLNDIETNFETTILSLRSDFHNLSTPRYNTH